MSLSHYPKGDWCSAMAAPPESCISRRRMFHGLQSPIHYHSSAKMEFLEVSWRSAFWTLLLSIVIYNPLVQASNVAHLTFDWKESLPGVVQNELSHRPKARSYIQEEMYNNRSLEAYRSYMANVTVGTPGQSLSLVIENYWSETILLAATAY
jgi:hypothetical protein